MLKPFELINKNAQEIYEDDLNLALKEGVTKELSMPYFKEQSDKGILLIHGFAASPKEMLPLTKELENRGYTVYSARVAGHGTSIDDMIKKSYIDWYNSLSYGYNALLKSCNKICITGQSNGGLLAGAVSIYNSYSCLALLAPAFKVHYPLIFMTPYVKWFIKSVPRKLRTEDKEYNYSSFPLKPTDELLKLAKAVSREISVIDKPVLTAVSEKDVLISPKKAIGLTESMASGDKTILTYDNVKNRITHILTTNRSLNIVKDIADWIERKLV